MCDLDHASLAPLAEDEYVLDTPRVRGFVADVRAVIARAGSPLEAVEALEPLFTELLADETWLPAEFQAPAPESGMGGGIGQWLVFRAADRSLSLFSLVVPPGSMTPVHDHLAWGLVGLYGGNQDEEFYRTAPVVDGRRPAKVASTYSVAGRSRRATSTRCCRPRTTSTASAQRQT